MLLEQAFRLALENLDLETRGPRDRDPDAPPRLSPGCGDGRIRGNRGTHALDELLYVERSRLSRSSAHLRRRLDAHRTHPLPHSLRTRCIQSRCRALEFPRSPSECARDIDHTDVPEFIQIYVKGI